MRKSCVGLSAAALVLFAGQSAFGEDKSFRQEDAHVHGAALLNVVVEGEQLSIEMESPAANIVGFEHKPGNAEQEKAISDAKEALADGAKLFFTPAAAGCVLAKAAIEWTLEEEDHEQGGVHHDGDDKDHGKEDSHAEHEDEETHAEFHAAYTFQCQDTAGLEFIDILIFETFPGTEEIEAQVIGPGGQSAVELNAGAARITF